MPILWNVSKRATLETKYDGQVFTFLPDEKKKLYIPDIVTHLIYKLSHKGLVEVPDDLNDEAKLRKIYLEGLKRRKAMLKDVIVQYQTANQERKAAHRGTVEPNEYEVECVREIREIEKEITETGQISKEDSKLVKDYLKEEGMSEEEIEKTQTGIATDKAGDSKLTGSEEAQDEAQKPQRRGRPRVNAAP